MRDVSLPSSNNSLPSPSDNHQSVGAPTGFALFGTGGILSGPESIEGLPAVSASLPSNDQKLGSPTMNSGGAGITPTAFQAGGAVQIQTGGHASWWRFWLVIFLTGVMLWVISWLVQGTGP